MKNKATQEQCFRVISQDKITVKKQYQVMTFSVFHNHSEITKISINPSNNNLELMTALKRKLSQKHFPVDKILFLQSLKGDQVVDYSLQISNYPLSNYKNCQQFNLVIQEDVSCDNMISLNDFKFMKCLGQGASASVFLVRHRGNGRLYALKQIEKSYFVEFKRIQQVLRQKKIMAQLLEDFPFVAKLFASFQSERHLNFLLEFYPGGEMFYHLQRQRLSEEEAKLYFCQMVLTFQYLHHKKIVYRDLKPQNIMIDFNGHARLTDFGLCKINLTKDDLTTSYCGSIEYMAPQIKESNGYNYSVDFYTLGAFLYEMVMGVPPYYNNQPLFFNENISSHYQALVKGLIETEVADRISSFKTIKSCQWLKNIKWQEISRGKKKMPLRVLPYETYIHDEFKQISAAQFNGVHQEKYDKLFDFFSYFRKQKENVSLLECYHLQDKRSSASFSKKPTTIMNSMYMKKKDSKDKSMKNRSSNSNSRSKKGSTNKSSSRPRKNLNNQNIYVKKSKEDLDFHRSISPKTMNFKKTLTLKSVKSGSDLIKGVLQGRH